MISANFNSLIDLMDYFKTDIDCIKHLEKIRWPDGPVSPFDETSKVYVCKFGYKCKNTGKYFTVTTGTIFQGRHITMRQWFVAIWLFINNRGISSVKIAEHLGVTQKTGWDKLDKLRDILKQENDGILSGEVQADETYYGELYGNMHADRKEKLRAENKGKGAQGRSLAGKTPIFGMLQKGGKLLAYVVPNVKGSTLKPIIYQKVKEKTIVHTDEWGAYDDLKEGYERRFVEHGKGIYGKEDTNTNAIEGAWSIFKRMIKGIYHSVDHLQKYVDEFVCRYNYRNLSNSERFSILLNLSFVTS